MIYEIACPSCKYRNEVDLADKSTKPRCRMCYRALRVPAKVRRAERKRVAPAKPDRVPSRRPPRAARRSDSTKAPPRSLILTLFGWFSHATTAYAVLMFLIGGAVVYEATNPTVTRYIYQSIGPGGGGGYGGGYGGGGGYGPNTKPPGPYDHLSPQMRKQIEDVQRINRENRERRERMFAPRRTPQPGGQPRSPYPSPTFPRSAPPRPTVPSYAPPGSR